MARVDHFLHKGRSEGDMPMKKLPILFLCACMAAACTKTETPNTSATETSATETMSTDTASTTSSTLSSAATSLSHDDQEFLTKTAEGGMAEVDLGNLAAQSAAAADVKTFASQMVTDHSKANDELKQLATQKSFTLPAEPNQEQKDLKAKLAAKSGKEFDKDYMKAMVDDHEKVVKAFENAAANAGDADVKAWAAKTLPTLQHHLEMAKATEKKVK
jgi:putative membrane protein